MTEPRVKLSDSSSAAAAYAFPCLRQKGNMCKDVLRIRITAHMRGANPTLKLGLLI